MYGTRRWFTAKSSASTEAVYEYFALYQLRLAIVLTNYWKTEHETFSTATVQRLIDGIHTNVDTQKTDRLKPPVPADKFIDTRTMTIWDKKPAWVSGEQYTPIEVCHCTKYAGQYCELRDPNWEDRAKGLGTEDDFRRLIDGWDLNSRCGTPKDPKPCSNPLEWLRKEVELATSSPGDVPRDWSGFMWLGPHPVPRARFGFIGCGYNWIARINLNDSEKPGPHVFRDTLYDRDPQNYFAHAMTRQGVAPGTYWWPLGGQ